MQQEIRCAQQGKEAADLHISEVLEMGLISATEQLQVARLFTRACLLLELGFPTQLTPSQGL